tara:strand:+ start:3233 stop:3514 length:282 start_codon:yes stop_codon:yes gene_type:complete
MFINNINKMPPKKAPTDDTATAPKKRGRPKKVIDTETPDVKTKAPKTKAPVKASGKGGDWKGHLKKTFDAGKKKDPKYKYSQAMKDAKLTYKK